MLKYYELLVMFVFLSRSFSMTSTRDKMDTVYPEPLSRILRRTERRSRDRGNKGTASRYRTQPVTFSEIQEVDEDNLDDDATESNNNAGPVLVSKSEHDLKTKLDTLFLNCPTGDQRPRKRTMKSLNRLTVEGRPTMGNIPASPESPPQDKASAGTRLLTQPRTSI